LASASIFKSRFRKIFFFLVIPVLVYTFFAILPILWAAWHSLHTDFQFQIKFAWFKNYDTLIHDPDFWHSFRNNIIIIGINFLLQIVLAFIIAIWLHSKFIVMRNLIRSLIFFPTILAPIVVSFLWRLIYNVDYGLINTVLRGIGLGGLARAWLADPSVVIYAVTFPMTWQYTGFFVVIFLAGLTNIDPDLLDAAQIDGANGWQRGIHVILPLMAGTWRAVLILSTANGMKVFEHPFVMTHGGPGVSSAVIAVYAVINVFMRNHLTYGSTIAMAGLILSFGLILVAVLMMDYVIVRRRQ